MVPAYLASLAFLEANRQQFSERDAQGSHKIVLRHRVRRHRDLVAGADDQVDRPSRRVVADREAAENEAGREQNLGEADVLPV